jgi:hypothetical protein
MKKIEWILVLLIGALSACTWVKPTDAGQNVRLVSYDQVSQCKKLGKATVSVLDKVGFISRSDDKIDDELRIMAKNSAADMGGDTIVVAGAVSRGEQAFDVYQCGR